MSLEDLRAKEERVRSQLVVVRATLASAVVAIADATHARAELAIVRGGTRSEGVYRDSALERAPELHARIDAANSAAAEREHMRRVETSLLEELESVRRGIERAGIRRNVLPILDHALSATPCTARWDEMEGDGDARTCAKCKATVLNLVMLEPAQAMTLLAGRKNLHRRMDGTILSGDCPGAPQLRLRLPREMIAVLLLFVVGGVVFFFATHPAVSGAPSQGYGDYFDIVGSSHYEADGHLELATSVHVHQGYPSMLGPHDLDATLTRSGTTFVYTLQCSNGRGKASEAGTIDAPRVEDFLQRASALKVNERTPRTRCPHTDDLPKFDVEVTTASKITNLTVRNCSRQWYVEGTPLAPESNAPRETPHPTLNRAYDALLDAIGAGSCEGKIAK